MMFKKWDLKEKYLIWYVNFHNLKMKFGDKFRQKKNYSWGGDYRMSRMMKKEFFYFVDDFLGQNSGGFFFNAKDCFLMISFSFQEKIRDKIITKFNKHLCIWSNYHLNETAFYFKIIIYLSFFGIQTACFLERKKLVKWYNYEKIF